MMRTLILLAIAIVPFNRLRILLYRSICGYDISYDCRIGLMNLFSVKDCSMEGAVIGILNQIKVEKLVMSPGASIGRFNKIKNVKNVAMGKNAVVNNRNSIMGTPAGLTPYKEFENFSLGQDSIVVAMHYFDLSDSITIGRNVTIGGRSTEIWTHGFDLNHVKIQAPVEIGNDVYMGSRCSVMPGVTIADRVSIGSGTLIPKSVTESGYYVSSQLIRKGDVADFTEEPGVVTHNGYRFLRK